MALFLIAILGYRAASWTLERKGLPLAVPILGTSIFVAVFVYGGLAMPGSLGRSVTVFASIYVGMFGIARPLILALSQSMVVTDVALSDVAEGMIPDETVDLGEGAPAIRESHALDDAGLRELQTRAEAGELDQLQ